MIKIKLNNLVEIQEDDELFSDKYHQKIFDSFNKFFVSYKVFNFQELENFAFTNAEDYKYSIRDLEVEELDERQQTQDQNLENENSIINLSLVNPSPLLLNRIIFRKQQQIIILNKYIYQKLKR